MEIKLVVFDMDDTLFLERTYVESGFRAVGEMLARDYNLTTFFDPAWNRFQLGERGDIFDSVLGPERQALPNDIVQRCVETYRNHEPKIELLTDSLTFLRDCQSNYQTALVTDGPAKSQRAKVRILDLDHYIQRIIVTDEHGKGWAKPALTAFEVLQEWANVPGVECVYIGDNPKKDFVAARALGWKTIRVRRAGGLHAQAETDVDAEFEVPDLMPESMNRIGPSFISKTKRGSVGE
ncbi:HAD family hydrolase [Cryobacterium sp. TMT1-3]|uniref:HAD family hydrolase n=1 Tax=Cryobacterium sp. TMT1-3 TaxID=1259237 RepID=UPI00106CAF47|nr:HAD family hydrolase [Cryobacterium sp. TMT1-3]TFC29349.1 HAD family hydrolase [Cryobacterium sp. TMT1-3]